MNGIIVYNAGQKIDREDPMNGHYDGFDLRTGAARMMRAVNIVRGGEKFG